MNNLNMNIPFRLPEHQPILILDRTADLSSMDVLHHFAMDELLCSQTGNGGPAICHLWRHPRAFVMGVRDSRLPMRRKAMPGCVPRAITPRSATPAAQLFPDAGVVNLSLILPFDSTGKAPDFHDDFEVMVQLIRDALHSTGAQVDTGEIAGAFCPGTYDLSIGGLKFCGIAQRRQRHANIIQAFIIASGSGSERARLVRSFYDIAASGAAPGSYPLVEESSTASLEELIPGQDDAVNSFTHAVKDVVRRWQSGYDLTQAAARFKLPSADDVREMADKLRQRYADKLS